MNSYSLQLLSSQNLAEISVFLSEIRFSRSAFRYTYHSSLKLPQICTLRSNKCLQKYLFSILFCFVLIWASRTVILQSNTGLIFLACPTWRLAQKCPERTTLNPLFPRLKGLLIACICDQPSSPRDSNPQDAEEKYRRLTN